MATATESETMVISKREFTTVMNNLEVNKDDLEEQVIQEKLKAKTHHAKQEITMDALKEAKREIKLLKKENEVFKTKFGGVTRLCLEKSSGRGDIDKIVEERFDKHIKKELDLFRRKLFDN